MTYKRSNLLVDTLPILFTSLMTFNKLLAFLVTCCMCVPKLSCSSKLIPRTFSVELQFSSVSPSLNCGFTCSLFFDRVSHPVSPFYSLVRTPLCGPYSTIVSILAVLSQLPVHVNDVDIEKDRGQNAALGQANRSLKSGSYGLVQYTSCYPAMKEA